MRTQIRQLCVRTVEFTNDPFLPGIERNSCHLVKIPPFYFRCATGEAWPDIMLACEKGRPCHEKSHKYNGTTGKILDPEKVWETNTSFILELHSLAKMSSPSLKDPVSCDYRVVTKCVGDPFLTL